MRIAIVLFALRKKKIVKNDTKIIIENREVGNSPETFKRDENGSLIFFLRLFS